MTELSTSDIDRSVEENLCVIRRIGHSYFTGRFYFNLFLVLTLPF